MVQGLAFLSKKSWHTKNLANQEKVWIAEQRKAAEESKTKELARQIQQEREREEFDRLAGKKTLLDRGIDWMYQGHAATGDSKQSALEQEDAAKKAEEFLLGKEYVAQGSAQGDFTQGAAAMEGVNAVVKLEASGAAAAAASMPSSHYGEASVADRNEAFRQRVEDPMYMVSQKEREKKHEAKKQQALYERVVGPRKSADSDKDDNDDNGDDDDGGSKKLKHERKRDRKERRRREKESRKKKRHRHRSDESEDSEEDDKEKHERKRRRHRDRDHYDRDSSDYDDRRKGHRHHYRRIESHDDDSDRDGRHRSSSRRQRSRSRDDEDRKSHKSISNKRNYGSSSRNRSRSRSPGESHHRRRPRNDYDRDYDRQIGNHDEGRSHQHHKRDEDHYHHNDNHKGDVAKRAGYGLQGGKSSSSNERSPKDLGPAQELLRQKRLTAEEERRRARDRASSRRTMTAEERAKAIQDMQATAQARRCDVSSNRDDLDDTPSHGNASFLKDLTEQTHGIKGPSQSLSSRMAQNRNTQQRLHDDSFL